MQYSIIITNLGRQILNQSLISKVPIQLTTLKLSESEEAITEDMKTVHLPVAKIIPITSIRQLPNDIIELQGVVSAKDGGFVINEIGVCDSDDNLICIAKYPRTEKLSNSSGVSSELTIRLHIRFSGSSEFSIIEVPNGSYATKEYVDEKLESIISSYLSKSTINKLLTVCNQLDNLSLTNNEILERLSNSTITTEKISDAIPKLTNDGYISDNQLKFINNENYIELPKSVVFSYGEISVDVKSQFPATKVEIELPYKYKKEILSVQLTPFGDEALLFNYTILDIKVDRITIALLSKTVTNSPIVVKYKWTVIGI